MDYDDGRRQRRRQAPTGEDIAVALMAAALPCDGNGSGRQGGDAISRVNPRSASALSFSNYDDGRWQSRQQASHGGDIDGASAAAAVVE